MVVLREMEVTHKAIFLFIWKSTHWRQIIHRIYKLFVVLPAFIQTVIFFKEQLYNFFVIYTHINIRLRVKQILLNSSFTTLIHLLFSFNSDNIFS